MINLQNTYKLGRAWRYANPRTPTDYLPAAYGDIKGGNKGLWDCPCIDTVNFYYLIADHTILSAGNGNSFTVYDKDGATIDPAGYTIVDDHTDENGKHVAIINFTADHETSEPVSIRCKGKNAGAALIENPISITEDFVVNLAGGSSADFDAFALQKAKDICTGYKAAGLLNGDRSIGTTLSEILYSFQGEWWKNHQNKIIIMMNRIDQVFDWKGELLERNIKNLTASRDEKNICNQAEVQYGYNYRLNKYEEGDDGSSTKDQLSQNVHGAKIETFDFEWCRDATTVAAIQAIVVNRLKNPIWIINFDEITLQNLHFERGDFVLLNHSALYDNQQNPFENRIIQLLTKVTNIDDRTISFELIDKGISYHSYSEAPEEIINITEIISKEFTKNVSEQVNIAEFIVKGFTKGVSEGVSITEAIAKYVEKFAVQNEQSGLVGLWHFDEGRGPLAHDSSGNGNDGTLVNMEDEDWVDGVAGKCLSFDGTDDYVNIGTVTTLGVRTFGFWLKLSSLSTNMGVIKFGGATAHDGFNVLGSVSPKRSILYLAGSNYQYFNTAAYHDNNWHHWVVYVAGSGINDIDNCSLFIDGNAITKGTTSKNGNPETWGTFNIGQSGYGYFNGLIDEVRIYNRALTPAEIAYLYNYPSGNMDRVFISEQAWKNAFQYDGIYDHDGSIRYGADYGVLI